MTEPRGAYGLVQPHWLSLEDYQAVDPPEVLAARTGIPESRIVKLNANENPYGPSPKVREAMGRLDRIHIYPDPQQLAMRKAIGDYLEIAPDHIVVGNGSDEIIDLLLRAFIAPGDTVINCPPSFGMYPFTTHVCGGVTVAVERDDRYAVDIPGVIVAAGKGAKTVILASPNNPTGNSIPWESVALLLQQGLVVIVDEAYREFGGQSLVPMVMDNPGLIVLRTFSKWAGLAGIRVGYGVMAPDMAAVLMRAKPPYSVNQAAETAVLASFDGLAGLRERVGWIIDERDRMNHLLETLPGVVPWPSEANFILCDVPEGKGRAVYEGLAAHGVFVRYFSNARIKDCIRISVGTPEQTIQLMAALAETLNR